MLGAASCQPTDDDVKMIEPPPKACILGITALHNMKELLTLTAIMLSQVSNSISAVLSRVYIAMLE